MALVGELICLGIESTAHTLGVGIVDDKGKILAEKREMVKTKLGSGFVPKELFEHHVAVADKLIKSALEDAKLKITGVDVFSFSQGMGIPNALRAGAAAARFLAEKYNKPLVGVNHAVAHIEIGKLTTGARDPVVLYLSGGNTQVIALAEGRYRIFGETEDIPVGNALDVIARDMNLPMPGGPEIEKFAKFGKYVDLPYVVKGTDLSFSGILTAAKQKLRDGVSKEDVAYSMQEVCFAMLTEVTERALAHIGKKEVLLVGGVAANKRLQEMLKIMCGDRGAKLFYVPMQYASDNGAMIAWNGILAYNSGRQTKIENSGVKQNWRTDEVEIFWVV